MVYEPRDDSFLLFNHIKSYTQGKKVLDMGTGSGIQAVEASRYAHKVLGVDIDLKAVEHCKIKYDFEVVHSDLFNNIHGAFDVIMFNPPYLPNAPYGALDTDGGLQGFETIIKFLREARHHLTMKGVVLIVVSSHSNQPLVEAEMRNLGYRYRIIEEKHMFFEKLFLYEIQ